jgi:hypothetical protein
MKREKIFALSVMTTSLLILGIVIALAKAYWTTSIEESRVMLNQTAPFERNAYQEREKQIFTSAQSASVLQNKSQK